MPKEGLPDLQRAMVFEATRGEDEKVAVLALWTEDQETADLEVILSSNQAEQLCRVLQLAIFGTKKIGH